MSNKLVPYLTAAFLICLILIFLSSFKITISPISSESKGESPSISPSLSPPLSPTLQPARPSPSPSPTPQPARPSPSSPCNPPANPKFYSQDFVLQDRRIYRDFFQNPPKCNGIIVEIGANEGIALSNSKFFEETLNWDAYLVEPNPKYHENLFRQRPQSKIFTFAISSEDTPLEFVKADALGGFLSTLDRNRVINEIFHGSEEEFRKNVVTVQTKTLEKFFEENNLREVDVLSVDVEGAELQVVSSIDYEKYYVRVLTIEANYADGPKNKIVKEYLLSHGFVLHEAVAFEETYISERFQRELQERKN